MFSSSMKKKECWKHINLFPSLFFSSSLLNDEQLVSLLLLKKKNTEKDKGFFKCFFFFLMVDGYVVKANCCFIIQITQLFMGNRFMY